MCDCDKREDNSAEASVPRSDLVHHDFPGVDPYATLLSMARLRAAKEFVRKYGREPVWSRTVLTVQNSEFRVSVSIREGLATETYMSGVSFTPPSRGSGNGRTRSVRPVGEGDGESTGEVGSHLRTESSRRSTGTRREARKADRNKRAR